YLELHSLRERQRGSPVDGAGLAAHVGFPGVGAGFAASSGLFLSSEGAADLGSRGSDVDVGDAAVAAGRGEEALGGAHVEGEDGGGEALGDVVVETDGLVQVVELE